MPFIKQTHLQLPDGRLLEFRRVSYHGQKFTIRKTVGGKRRVVFEHIFEQDHDRLWDHAFFVPVTTKKLVVDLDRDGNPEVGIATWDLGNNFERTALLFSVRRNSLVLVDEKPFDLASEGSIL